MICVLHYIEGSLFVRKSSFFIELTLYEMNRSGIMEFDWDERKNRTNFKKHGIRFEEARLIFQSVHFTKVDPRDYYDKHSQAEIREITIGTLEGGTVLVVCHTHRNRKKRIISARKATFKERRRYYEAFKDTAI